MRGIVFASTTALSIIFASTAFAGSNTVYLNQTGNSQNSNISQSGSNNYVGTSTANPFIQENGYGGGYNKLKVQQSGTGNAIGWYGRAIQSGSTNNANVSQSGTSNDLELRQVGTDNGNVNVPVANYDSPSKGTVEQSGKFGSVSIDQYGTANAFNVKQGGENNNVDLRQSGQSLSAVIRQSTSGPDSHSLLDYPGSGSHGTVKVYQGLNASSYSDFAFAAQGGGIGNQITINQDGSQQVASVWQKGTSNQIESYQSYTGNSLGKVTFNGAGTNAPFKQDGTSNYLLNVQYGSNNVVTGSQTGASNVVNTKQSGNGSTASFTQNGTTNRAYNTQEGTDILTVDQSLGPNNYVLNTQYDYAAAYIKQVGSGNSSTGTQSQGYNYALNTATVTQIGNDNNSVYSQTGQNNNLTVSQGGNANLSNVAQSGGGNQAVIQQN